jgi:hypothetical protein
MKKSKDITKYNIDWQIVRVQLKNKKEIEDKLAMAYSYFIAHKTKDTQERVVNWLEGLALGYKASKQWDVIKRIEEEKTRYEVSGKLKKEENRISTIDEMQRYDLGIRAKVYIDLYTRNVKWLKNGYVQKEINNFMDTLRYSIFKEGCPIVENYHRHIILLRKEASKIPNTHKFLF